MALGEQFPEILEAARLGTEWAWRVLHDDFAPGLIAYLSARGASDPEDLAGEAFLGLYRALPRFDGGYPELRTLAFTIAHHRLLDDRRSRRRRPEAGPGEALREVQGPADVEGEVIENIRTEEIRRLIETLSPDQQQVLLLRIIGGLGAEEIARVVGKGAWAVRALQRRGLAALGKKISREAIQL